MTAAEPEEIKRVDLETAAECERRIKEIYAHYQEAARREAEPFVRLVVDIKARWPEPFFLEEVKTRLVIKGSL